MSRLSNFSRAPEFLFRLHFASISRLTLALIFFATTGLVWAQDLPTSSISHQVKDVFGHAARAVVKVHGVDEHSEISGTGFFVDPTGTLYTSYTVGGEAGNFTIEFEGKEYPARQILADIRSGMAILKVDLATPALPIGKSEQLEIATPVVTIGYPLDLPETPSFGMIAGFDRKYLGRYFSTTHLRVNLACYALPIDAAEKIRRDFVRFGEARHGWIGINVSQAPASVGGSRAEMTEIMSGTPAADCGAKAGDILLQVGRTKVCEPEDVLDASFFITAGDIVPITVMRGNEKLTFNVQADFHPASQRPPLIAAPTMNQAIPLKLDSQVQRRP